MEYSIRQMTIADYEQIYAIWQKTPGMGLSSVDTRSKIELFLNDNPDLSFIAVNSLNPTEIIGTILCGNDSRRGFLYHLAVIPEFRKKGIAQDLIKHSLAGLRRIGIVKCHLFVLATNQSAVEYYRKLGWQERVDLFVFSSDC